MDETRKSLIDLTRKTQKIIDFLKKKGQQEDASLSYDV
jgi:hypothetical protein